MPMLTCLLASDWLQFTKGIKDDGAYHYCRFLVHALAALLS